MEAHSSNASGTDERSRRPGPVVPPWWRRRGPLLGLAVLVVVVAALALTRSSTPSPGGGGATGEPTHLVTGQPLSGLRAALAADDKAIDGVRAYAPYVAQGSAGRKEIALTFDDGPGPTTPALLRFLVDKQVPATFFLVGHEVAAHTDVVRREVDAGFSLGTHTENHARLGSLTAAEQAREILTAADRITRISRHAVRLFRPPYGSFDARTLRVLRAERMLMVVWSVDTKDYEATSARAIVKSALAGASAGRVMLFHDGPGPRPFTLAALRKLVPALRKRGYRFVSVPRLLRDDPPPRHQPPPSSLSG
jgi:peptidoglycan/xylan/chitin deacetylase (PgdA/CDA1 family)